MIIAYGQMRLDSPLSEVQEQGTLEQVFLQKVEAAGATLGGGEARA